jgi:hypothetical protein
MKIGHTQKGMGLYKILVTKPIFGCVLSTLCIVFLANSHVFLGVFVSAKGVVAEGMFTIRSGF